MQVGREVGREGGREGGREENQKIHLMDSLHLCYITHSLEFSPACPSDASALSLTPTCR